MLSVDNKQRVIGITREYLDELVKMKRRKDREKFAEHVIRDPLQRNVGVKRPSQP